MSVNERSKSCLTKETDLKFTSCAMAEKGGNEHHPKPVCEACSGPHRIWKCESFKKNNCKAKCKIILQNGLCNKCLERTHCKKLPQTTFQMSRSWMWQTTPYLDASIPKGKCYKIITNSDWGQ